MISLRNTRNFCEFRQTEANYTKDSSAQITKIIPSIRIIVWLHYQYKSNLLNLFYA